MRYLVAAVATTVYVGVPVAALLTVWALLGLHF